MNSTMSLFLICLIRLSIIAKNNIVCTTFFGVQNLSFSSIWNILMICSWKQWHPYLLSSCVCNRAINLLHIFEGLLAYKRSMNFECISQIFSPSTFLWLNLNALFLIKNRCLCMSMPFHNNLDRKSNCIKYFVWQHFLKYHNTSAHVSTFIKISLVANF